MNDGAVVIKAAFSSVTYKDALAATGAGKIMKRFPLIGGIALGAANVIARETLQMGTRPLEKAMWAGASIRSAARHSRG